MTLFTSRQLLQLDVPGKKSHGQHLQFVYNLYEPPELIVPDLIGFESRFILTSTSKMQI